MLHSQSELGPNSLLDPSDEVDLAGLVVEGPARVRQLQVQGQRVVPGVRGQVVRGDGVTGERGWFLSLPYNKMGRVSGGFSGRF